ncbi:hypothetical protein [Geosporobacter ferrireducens]|uniref:hypothetical protein n=1 Tax=Geosporobacter ferrireducens TaxID=1424294 RepID=UPI0023568BD0|nr:hypothetical protein [Geosporobacter ferrireducens]
MPNGTNAKRLPKAKIHSFNVSIERCLGNHKGIRTGIKAYLYSRIPANCGRPKPKNRKYISMDI